MSNHATRLTSLSSRLAELAAEATELGLPTIALQLTRAMTEAQIADDLNRPPRHVGVAENEAQP